MKTQLFVATIFLMMVAGSLAGRITPWADPDIMFPNSGRVQYMNLYFQLDNKLPTGHVLRVTLPFATTLALNSTSFTGLSSIYTGSSTSKGSYLTTATSSLSSAATVSVAKFSSAAPYTAHFTFTADLVAGTPYIFKLVFTTSPTDTGFVGYVQMETMSPALSITGSGSDTPISYDLNNAFAPVQLFAAPGNITSWNVVGDANSLVGGQSSNRQLSFVVSQNFFYWPLVQLTWDNTAFTISNVTAIDTGVNSSSVTVLTSGSGTNQYWTTQTTTTLSLYHNQPIFTNQTVKYNFTTANPSGTTSQTIQFSLRVMHRYNLNLTDVSTTNVSFIVANTSAPSTTSVTTVTIPGVSILLSWGIDPAVSSLTGNPYLSKVFQVYASPATTIQFQALRFVFGTNNTFASASYRVALTVCGTSTNCDVLENSITSGFATTACWTTIDSSARKIFCNTSSIATSGNYIGARIWFLGALAGAAGVQTAAAGFGASNSATPVYGSTTTFSDSAIGTISVTVPSNTSITAVTGSLNSSYNVLQFNAAPLANLNGNGPMAAVPTTGTNQAATNYADLWTGAAVDNSVLAATGAPTNAWPAQTVAVAAGNIFGGIFGTATANAKYNAVLFTTGNMITTSTSTKNTFTGVTGAASLTIANTANPGIDIFMNPNIYSNAGSNQAITSCWAANAATRSTSLFSSNGTTSATAAAGVRVAHCFVNSVTTANQTYFRIRNILTGEAAGTTIAATAGTNIAAGIDAVPAASGSVLLGFYWETAFQINNSYAGTSLKADNNVNDFYGAMYTVTVAAVANNPLKSSATTTDLGELSSTFTGLATSANPIALATPFFWTQPILMSHGAFTGTTSPYFKGVSAFITGVTTTTASYTTNTLVWILRVRGVLTSAAASLDLNMYPSSGKLALFINTPKTTTASTALEPLGPVNFTNYAGDFNRYNTASGPLVGNGAVRCWNAGALANCLHDRTGRALPLATYQPSTVNDLTTGTPNIIDLYQIISTDATYTSNFSVAILVKPKAILAADFALWKYRLAFQVNSTGNYYIQPWDQSFGQGSYNSTGTITPITYTYPSTTATQAPASTVTACTVAPFTSTSTTVPSIRLQPATTDADNTLITATPLLVQASANNISTTGTNAAKQGAFVWCVQWNFRQGAFSIGSNSLENAVGDKCVGFDYLAYESSSYINWYCIYCPIAAGSLVDKTQTSAVNITLNNFFTGPAVNIYNSSYHFIAGDDGGLLETANCASISGNSSATNTTLWIPQTIATTSVSSSYNVSAQKVSIAFTAPSTIATTMVDSIQIQGKNQSAASNDASFPYATLDTAYVCKLVPTASVSNVSAYISCTVTLSSGVITITPGTISGANGYVTGWTVIIWGINGNNYTAATLPNSTYFTITTYKSSTIVDQSNTTNTSYGVWSLSTSNSVYFSVPTVGYQRNILNARGWFRFDLTFSQRPWFNTDKVVINLDAIVSSTVNANSSVVKCRITDTSDVISQIFQSCTLALTTTPPTVTIIAMPQSSVYGYEVALATSGVRVYLDNVVVLGQQTNKTVYGGITFLGSGAGTTSALTKLANTTDITPVNLTSLAFPSGYPTITKYWNNANDFQDLVFGLYTNTSFNSSCRITIVFPSYYNPGLTVRSTTPYCTINNVYSQCVVGTVTSTGVVSLSQGLRQLVLYGASNSIANGSLVVRVNGISAPPATYTTETFWIQINGDNTDSATSVVYCGAVNDSAFAAPSAAVLPLNVIWYGVSAATTRSFVTYQWSVYLNNATATVNTSSAVQVVFPESWGLGWGIFTPTCTVSDFTNSSVAYSSAATTNIYGNLVNMNISTAIAAGSVFNVSCSNVRTDNFDGYYRSQDVTIRIADPNGTFVWWRNAPGQDNVNYTSIFAKGSSQSYVSWSAGSLATSPVALTAGTYSASVTATVPSKSSRSFTIAVSNSNFAFLSSTAPFWIVTGATSNTTQLGCAGSVPVGLYGLTFTVSDNSSTYVAPPTLYVAVNSNAIAISPSSSTLSAFFSASSLSSTAPLTFDLSAYPPYSDITITPSVVGTNTNFTFTPSSIKITPASPKAYFTWTSTSAATVVGSAVYTFAITGTNAASYTLSSSVTVGLSTDSGTGSTNTPTLTVTADGTDVSAATSKVISFTLSQVTQANIYWVVTLQGQSITDATAIWMNAAALTAYNANSANQAQYSTFYQSTTTKSQTITNLFPNTGYTVTAVAVSNTNKSSTVASYTFVTGANSAVIQRWIFNYSTSAYPSQSQRQSLLCLLTQNLAVPAINVRNVHGEICGNTTAFYSTTNSTGDLGVYFYPLQATADTTMTAAALQTALNGTTTNVLSSMNTTLSAGTSGIGWLSAFVDLASIRNAAPGLTLPTSIPSAQLTTTSIYFTLTASNDTGFLFVTLAANSSSTPTAVAMKQAAANISSITGAISTQVFYFYPGTTLSYNFTGLTAATTYNLYVVASNNDPSFLQNFTSVSAISVSTPSTTSGSSTGQIGVIFSVMAVFVSVISLMFF